MPEFELPSGNEFIDQDMDYESMLSFFEEALIQDQGNYGNESEGLVSVVTKDNEVLTGPFLPENDENVKDLDSIMDPKSKEAFLELNNSNTFKELLKEMDAFNNLSYIFDDFNSMADFRSNQVKRSSTSMESSTGEITINLIISNASKNSPVQTPQPFVKILERLAFEMKNASAFANDITTSYIRGVAKDPDYRIQDFAYDLGMIEATASWTSDVILGELGYKPKISSKIEESTINQYFSDEILTSHFNLGSYIILYNLERPLSLPYENRETFGDYYQSVPESVTDYLRQLIINR